MKKQMAVKISGVLLGLCLSACMSVPAGPDLPIETVVEAPAEQTSPWPAAAPRPAAYGDLPDWEAASLMEPLRAMRRSCALWEMRADDDLLSPKAPYAGRFEEWRGPCAGLDVAGDDESARLVFEALFVPVEVDPGGTKPRFTGYFEPEIMARRRPVWPYVQPIPGLPDDLVKVPASALGGSSSEPVPAQKLENGELRPYPARRDIRPQADRILGYGHPGDVFFLQIQGSGRLTFEDGTQIRAAYAAHNGRPFRSTANWLLKTGRITPGEASMQGIRAWMERAGIDEARLAMDQNPRFVFFQPKPIGEVALGPVGAQNVPLTPLGSLAVDTRLHALGVPMFVETTAPGLGGAWSGLMVAQDTGGAIRGPVRGDIYFGTGPEAGARAGTMNAPGRLWVLLPKAVAARLVSPDVAS